MELTYEVTETKPTGKGYYAVYRPYGRGHTNEDPNRPNSLFRFPVKWDRSRMLHQDPEHWEVVSAREARKIINAANSYGNNGLTPGDGRRDGRSWNFLDVWAVSKKGEDDGNAL